MKLAMVGVLLFLCIFDMCGMEGTADIEARLVAVYKERKLTSLIKAYMGDYMVLPKEGIVVVKDYLDFDIQYKFLVTEFNVLLQYLCADSKERYDQQKPFVDSNETNANVRDMQRARERLVRFHKGIDLMQSCIKKKVKSRISGFRQERWDAFSQEDAVAIERAAHNPVKIRDYLN